jgi:serine/threonine protein kinase/tetratricopeptide (TPR) repeat protein
MLMADTETIQTVDPSAIRLGSDFGSRYRIEALVGQGGMGRVYKAYDKELNRTVAIKVIRRGVMGEADALSRFKQELVLASRISQKNILRIHDLGEVDGVKFMTMAYVEGQDLYQVMKANPKLPLERVLKFAAQFAGALAAAHAEGVVHRDLKPQNILVDKNDQIYISDFGLARSFAEGALGMTQAGAVLGTPRYMSPEQVEGKTTDGRSDLYAYGLILYEMVTGDVPFTGESTISVMYQRLREKPKSPKVVNPEIPSWLALIIMKCLERTLTDRYQSAYEILADLQGSQSGSGVSRGWSRHGSTVQIQIPEFANRRWVLAVGGVVVVILLSLAIPTVRHAILGGSGKSGGSSISGVPPFSSGRFVAVLPLQILGDSTQIGYIAQGIEETLSAKLVELKDVRVAPSEESGKANQKQPVAKIARALGSNLLVQGTLQGGGDKIRVTMHLEDVVDGKRLWTQEFNGIPADLLTMEDQIYGQLIVALNINPSNSELANAKARPTENSGAYDLYLRGRNSLRSHDTKKIQEALDYFNRALQADGKFGLAYTGIADASLRMNGIKKDSFWTQKALSAGQQAAQLNDSLPEVHFVLGSIYSDTGRYAEAIAELNRAISLAPTSDEGYRRLGAVYLKSGNGAQAIQAFQKAIQLNEYFWLNQNELGSAYYQLGDYSKALQAFQQIIVLEPDLDVGYENVGNVYLQQGKFQECVPFFEQALQREPYFSTYSNLGTAYFYLKQYPKAVEMFEKAAALNPNDTTVTVNLADAYRGAALEEKARSSYQKAISLGFKELETNPQNADVLAQIALAYAKMGDFKQADSFMIRARTIDKNNVNYIYDDAEINALAGRTKQSLKALRESLDMHFPAAYAVSDPELHNIQNDPEFSSLVKRASNP